MNFQCPNCQADYAVPNTRLGTRQVVRCSACDHTWTIGDTEEDQEDKDPEASADTTDDSDETESEEPIEDEQDQPAAPVATGEPAARLSPPLSASPAPNRWLTAAWAGSAAAITACVVAACLYQTNVVTAWPPAGRLFATNHVVSIEPIKAPKPDTAGRAEPSKP